MREDIIVEYHLPLIVSIALAFKPANATELDEMVQIGRVALLEAHRAFDKKRKVQFSTYATKCIRNALIQEFTKKGASIERLPVDLVDPKGEVVWWEILPDNLGPIEFSLLKMKLEGYSLREIAEVMKCSKTWAGKQLQSIYKTIRKANE